MTKLAILGGDHVRTDPFPTWPRPTSALGDSVLKTLQNENWGVGSDAITRFEEAFAAFQAAKYCISTSSGTTALWVALKAAGVKAGDEVIIPAYTFIATASAVLMANAVPVFVDINEKTLNINPSARCYMEWKKGWCNRSWRDFQLSDFKKYDCRRRRNYRNE